MKIYISADIEGVTGITHDSETEKSKPDYAKFSEQMTNEVLSACEGAINAGADEIWVKDAHATGRNIIPDKLPENVKLVRGWSEHPMGMVQELDNTFDAVLFIGYHSPASSPNNPLSHTYSGSVNYIKINEKITSEFLINAYASATVNVPVVFLSGDEGICNEAIEFNKNIRTVAVNKGIGDSVISISPKLALKKIKEEVELALKGDISKCKIELPKHFNVEIFYKDPSKAYKASFYPNIKQISPTNVVFETDSYFEVLRMLMFVVF